MKRYSIADNRIAIFGGGLGGASAAAGCLEGGGSVIVFTSDDGPDLDIWDGRRNYTCDSASSYFVGKSKFKECTPDQLSERIKIAKYQPKIRILSSRGDSGLTSFWGGGAENTEDTLDESEKSFYDDRRDQIDKFFPRQKLFLDGLEREYCKGSSLRTSIPLWLLRKLRKVQSHNNNESVSFFGTSHARSYQNKNEKDEENFSRKDLWKSAKALGKLKEQYGSKIIIRKGVCVQKIEVNDRKNLRIVLKLDGKILYIEPKDVVFGLGIYSFLRVLENSKVIDRVELSQSECFNFLGFPARSFDDSRTCINQSSINKISFSMQRSNMDRSQFIGRINFLSNFSESFPPKTLYFKIFSILRFFGFDIPIISVFVSSEESRNAIVDFEKSRFVVNKSIFKIFLEVYGAIFSRFRFLSRIWVPLPGSFTFGSSVHMGVAKLYFRSGNARKQLSNCTFVGALGISHNPAGSTSFKVVVDSFRKGYMLASYRRDVPL